MAQTIPGKRIAIVINGDTEDRHLQNVNRSVQSLESQDYETLVYSTQEPETQADQTFINDYESFTKTLKGLNLTENDEVVVYLTGHGYLAPQTQEPRIRLKGVSDTSDLFKILDFQSKSQRTIIMDDCFSGGLSKMFLDDPKSLFVSAGSEDEVVNCTQFSNFFWSAEVTDYNHDGNIDWRERYQYTLQISHLSSNAQFLPTTDYQLNSSDQSKDEPLLLDKKSDFERSIYLLDMASNTENKAFSLAAQNLQSFDFHLLNTTQKQSLTNQAVEKLCSEYNNSALKLNIALLSLISSVIDDISLSSEQLIRIATIQSQFIGLFYLAEYDSSDLELSQKFIDLDQKIISKIDPENLNQIANDLFRQISQDPAVQLISDGSLLNKYHVTAICLNWLPHITDAQSLMVLTKTFNDLLEHQKAAKTQTKGSQLPQGPLHRSTEQTLSGLDLILSKVGEEQKELSYNTLLLYLDDLKFSTNAASILSKHQLWKNADKNIEEHIQIINTSTDQNLRYESLYWLGQSLKDSNPTSKAKQGLALQTLCEIAKGSNDTQARIALLGLSHFSPTPTLVIQTLYQIEKNSHTDTANPHTHAVAEYVASSLKRFTDKALDQLMQDVQNKTNPLSITLLGNCHPLTDRAKNFILNYLKTPNSDSDHQHQQGQLLYNLASQLDPIR